MSKVHGQIVTLRSERGRMTWRIAVGINRRSGDVSIVDSGWGYLTETTALAAARRWAKRLNITIDNLKEAKG